MTFPFMEKHRIMRLLGTENGREGTREQVPWFFNILPLVFVIDNSNNSI